MRVAVISDIHGNLRALEAVLDDVEREAPDELWCLGDTVGYGPRPNECCALVRERADACLAGNHDLAVLGAIDIAEFSHDAAVAARWTRQALDPDARAFLDGLGSEARRAGAALFHASALDPVWEYVLSPASAEASLAATTEGIVLVGHSHVALAAALAGGEVVAGQAPAGTEVDLDAARWLLNPGSVGQPRDGDPDAAWLLLDLDARFGSFRRVAYPIDQTQDEIRRAGLPEGLAARLAHGT